MPVEFRPATVADYPAICDLVPDEDELFFVYPRGRFPLTVAQVEGLARVRCDLTVAVEAGKVVGLANLYDLVPGASAFVGNVVIARDRRGQGLGQRLVNHMLDLVLERYGLPEARIAVFCINTPALGLYVALGFKPYDIELREHPRGGRIPLLLMRLPRAYRRRPPAGA